MFYQRPTRGSDAKNVLFNASLWSDIVDLVNAWKGGAFNVKTTKPRTGGALSFENTTGSDVNAGECLQIQPMTALPTGTGDDDAVHWAFHRSPIMEADDAVWHTAIDNLIAVQTDVATGEYFGQTRFHFGTVLATQTDAADRYVMVDPSNTREMITADAGIWKVIAYDGHGRCVVDFRYSQPLWRYELTQDSQTPAATESKLLRLDGSEFSTGSVTEIVDPDGLMEDQVTGDKGWCVHVGNQFIAQQAVC